MEFTDSEGASADSEGETCAPFCDRPGVKFSSTKKRKQSRRKFSYEEKEAIRAGVKKFGLGKWSEIKCAYFDILEKRSAVNIKVRVTSILIFIFCDKLFDICISQSI